MLYVIQNEEVVHMRSHWVSNMTGSQALDTLVDYTMMAICGTSKESFRRRHVAAHYADVANVARIFSDVWLPFITLPPIYYLMPHRIWAMAMDKEYCSKEKLNRQQLFIEAIGLYVYMIALFVELYLGSFWLAAFHMTPLLIYHASQILAATISHSGVDKRNSFNSNGLFDVDTATGLFKLSLKMVCVLGNWGPVNHAIHHAFSQLPLEIINRDHKQINKYCLETYKNVRYNNMFTMIVHKNILDRLGEPKWYDYCIQFFVTFGVIGLSVLTILGLPVPPVIFELGIVDYRAYLISNKAQRYANILGMWNEVELMQRKEELINPNAYFVLHCQFYQEMLDYLKKYHPNQQITDFRGKLCSQEVYQFNVTQRGKSLN